SYLNEMYLGQRGGLAIRGVGAAARAYFRKEIHQLTLAEAAMLVGMIRAPNSYSPVLNPERARQRRDVVLGRLRDLGRVTEAQHAAARREPIRVAGPAAPGQVAPYFTDWVRQEMEQRLGDGLTGARVLTTLDLALQRLAEGAVNRGLERLEARRPRLRRAEPADRLQAVLVALEPSTGRIRALVGGRDYQTSQFNRVVSARRQPGSAFKPFVYLAALERQRGGGPAFTPATFVDDSPLTLTVGGAEWSPRNYEDHYEGRVTVRRALEQSLNAATVRIAMEIGLPSVIETARTLGVTSRLTPVPAMVLGAFEVTPLELARAYLPLAGGGLRPEAVSAVAAAWLPDGSPLEVPKVQAAEVISAAEAYLVTTLLQGAVHSGTAAPARSLGVTGDVAGKTGTTNDGRDAWFVGYTPTLVVLVWVGFDSGEAHGLSAAQAALPIWADFMHQALDAYPAPGFAVPAGIVAVNVDSTNGRAANRWCPLVSREVFLSGSEPAPCDEHGFVTDHIVDWWRRFRDWLSR
ncbi:MAG: penicillin-binding transpeptidase domain-containing protein, partial [Candidatus Rokuibacteriota bacterium]